MRRVTFSVIAVGAIFLALGNPALAAPTPTPGASNPSGSGAVTRGKQVCSVADTKLTEITGIVATSAGYVVVNGAADNQPDSHRQVFTMTAACKLGKTKDFPSDPFDPQDIARGKDGVLWLADIGDTDKNRNNIALWKVPADLSAAPVIHRMSYPDGKHDAKALLISGDGTPIVMTKEINGTANLYSPGTPLVASKTVELAKVGTVKLPKTYTVNPFGPPGRFAVVGAASSPDGSKVVLRTYADAFEWDVKAGDVVDALTKGKARVTPLTDESPSEAITYSVDGSLLVTASHGTITSLLASTKVKPILQSYTPVTEEYVTPLDAPDAKKAGKSWLVEFVSGLTLNQTYGLLGGVGGFGALLVVIGVLGMVNGKKKRAKAAKKAAAKKAAVRADFDDFGDLSPVSGDNSSTTILAPVSGYSQGYGGYGSYGGYPEHQGAGYQQPYQQGPPQDGYPDQGGYPPQQGGGYPPQPGGYPPQGGGYPPAQGGGYPPQGGY